MQAARPRAPPRSDIEGPQGQASLRALLVSLAGETADLATSADELQGLFGQLLSDTPVRPDDALQRAQALDGLVQRLQGMKAFLSDMSSRALHDLPGDTAQAASNLRLTSQARRFSPEDAAAWPGLGVGDCDLF